MKSQTNIAGYEEIMTYLENSGASKRVLEGFKEINDNSIRDPLTGLSNRGYLEHRLKEEIANSKRHKTHLSAILMDIDYFKKVNDTYGHHAGDTVLENVADYLKNEILREGDTVVRYGGEEFLILLPHTEKEKAYIVAERIRKDIENKKIKIEDNKSIKKDIKITFSLGVSELSDIVNKTDSGNELIKKADEALYKAKEEGRNRVK